MWLNILKALLRAIPTGDNIPNVGCLGPFTAALIALSTSLLNANRHCILSEGIMARRRWPWVIGFGRLAETLFRKKKLGGANKLAKFATLLTFFSCGPTPLEWLPNHAACSLKGLHNYNLSGACLFNKYLKNSGLISK